MYGTTSLNLGGTTVLGSMASVSSSLADVDSFTLEADGELLAEEASLSHGESGFQRGGVTQRTVQLSDGRSTRTRVPRDVELIETARVYSGATAVKKPSRSSQRIAFYRGLKGKMLIMETSQLGIPKAVQDEAYRALQTTGKEQAIRRYQDGDYVVDAGEALEAESLVLAGSDSEGDGAVEELMFVGHVQPRTCRPSERDLEIILSRARLNPGQTISHVVFGFVNGARAFIMIEACFDGREFSFTLGFSKNVSALMRRQVWHDLNACELSLKSVTEQRLDEMSRQMAASPERAEISTHRRANFCLEKEFPRLLLPPEHRDTAPADVSPQVVAEVRGELSAVLNSLFQRLTIPIATTDGQIVMVRYFPYLMENLTTIEEGTGREIPIDPSARLMPSGGVVRSAIGYVYSEIYRGLTAHPPIPASETLRRLREDTGDVPGFLIRGVGSDFDVLVSCAPENVAAIKARVLDITNSAEKHFGVVRVKGGMKRSLFSVGDVKEYSKQTERSTKQGGSTLDFLAFDMETGAFIEPDGMSGIVDDMIRGEYSYVAPEHDGAIENPIKQTVRGIRALVELPFLSLKDETVLRAELEKLKADLEAGRVSLSGGDMKKALEQFDKTLRNSRFSGAHNRFLRGREGSLEKLIKEVSLLISSKTRHATMPEFVDNFPVAGRTDVRAELGDMPRAGLISIEEFEAEHTDNGVFYHGTPRIESGLAIMRGGLIVSGGEKDQGGSACGSGGYASQDRTVALGYAGSDGMVFDLRLKMGQRVNVLVWSRAMADPDFADFVRRIEETGQDVHAFLARNHGVDIIVRGYVLIQNMAVIDYPRTVGPMVHNYRSVSEQPEQTPSARIRAYYTYRQFYHYALALGETQRQDPAEEEVLRRMVLELVKNHVTADNELLELFPWDFESEIDRQVLRAICEGPTQSPATRIRAYQLYQQLYLNASAGLRDPIEEEGLRQLILSVVEDNVEKEPSLLTLFQWDFGREKDREAFRSIHDRYPESAEAIDVMIIEAGEAVVRRYPALAYHEEISSEGKHELHEQNWQRFEAAKIADEDLRERLQTLQNRRVICDNIEELLRQSFRETPHATMQEYPNYVPAVLGWIKFETNAHGVPALAGEYENLGPVVEALVEKTKPESSQSLNQDDLAMMQQIILNGNVVLTRWFLGGSEEARRLTLAALKGAGRQTARLALGTLNTRRGTEEAEYESRARAVLGAAFEGDLDWRRDIRDSLVDVQGLTFTTMNGHTMLYASFLWDLSEGSEDVRFLTALKGQQEQARDALWAIGRRLKYEAGMHVTEHNIEGGITVSEIKDPQLREAYVSARNSYYLLSDNLPSLLMRLAESDPENFAARFPEQAYRTRSYPFKRDIQDTDCSEPLRWAQTDVLSHNSLSFLGSLFAQQPAQAEAAVARVMELRDEDDLLDVFRFFDRNPEFLAAVQAHPDYRGFELQVLARVQSDPDQFLSASRRFPWRLDDEATVAFFRGLRASVRTEAEIQQDIEREGYEAGLEETQHGFALSQIVDHRLATDLIYDEAVRTRVGELRRERELKDVLEACESRMAMADPIGFMREFPDVVPEVVADMRVNKADEGFAVRTHMKSPSENELTELIKQMLVKAHQEPFEEFTEAEEGIFQLSLQSDNTQLVAALLSAPEPIRTRSLAVLVSRGEEAYQVVLGILRASGLDEAKAILRQVLFANRTWRTQIRESVLVAYELKPREQEELIEAFPWSLDVLEEVGLLNDALSAVPELEQELAALNVRMVDEEDRSYFDVSHRQVLSYEVRSPELRRAHLDTTRRLGFGRSITPDIAMKLAAEDRNQFARVTSGTRMARFGIPKAFGFGIPANFQALVVEWGREGVVPDALAPVLQILEAEQEISKRAAEFILACFEAEGSPRDFALTWVLARPRLQNREYVRRLFGNSEFRAVLAEQAGYSPFKTQLRDQLFSDLSTVSSDDIYLYPWDLRDAADVALLQTMEIEMLRSHEFFKERSRQIGRQVVAEDPTQAVSQYHGGKHHYTNWATANPDKIDNHELRAELEALRARAEVSNALRSVFSGLHEAYPWEFGAHFFPTHSIRDRLGYWSDAREVDGVFFEDTEAPRSAGQLAFQHIIEKTREHSRAVLTEEDFRMIDLYLAQGSVQMMAMLIVGREDVREYCFERMEEMEIVSLETIVRCVAEQTKAGGLMLTRKRAQEILLERLASPEGVRLRRAIFEQWQQHGEAYAPVFFATPFDFEDPDVRRVFEGYMERQDEIRADLLSIRQELLAEYGIDFSMDNLDSLNTDRVLDDALRARFIEARKEYRIAFDFVPRVFPD